MSKKLSLIVEADYRGSRNPRKSGPVPTPQYILDHSACMLILAARMPVPLPLRGFMFDAARLPEKLNYYEQLLDFLAAWGFNALLLRLTDDQGSALHWESH